MRAGILEHIITILHLQQQRNEFNEQEDRYVPICNTRAQVIDLSGGRKDENYETLYTYTKQFYVRRYVPVDEFDRILWRDHQYRILSITDDRTMNQKIITAEQVQNT